MTAGTAPLRDWRNLLPAAVGVLWLVIASGPGWLLLALLPATLLVATGVAALWWPDERRQLSFMALGAEAGIVLGLLGALLVSVPAGLAASAASLLAWLFAGHRAITETPLPDSVPAPLADQKTHAKAALDEAMVGWFLLLARVPAGEEAVRMVAAAQAFERVLSQRGWVDRPAGFHRAPPPPEDVQLRDAVHGGIRYQRMKYASGFVVDGALPGAADWAALEPNRDCYAHLFRQPHAGRPWLIGVHGYRMGSPWMDLGLFSPAAYHRHYGLNLVVPALPLHGPRRVGRMSGDRFLDGDLLDLLHAETQTLWDLRRLIAWIRQQEPDARIGVLGYSLGGYNTALLAGHESGLDFAVAGIPVSDFASMLWGHIPAPSRRWFEANGLTEAFYARLLRVVSPLAVAPKLPPARLHLFGGSADRVVPPPQVVALGQHWNRPVHWYAGGHLSFRGEKLVSRTIRDAMTGAGWALPD